MYNGGGTPLEAQEIRNGIYQNVLLYKLINEYSDKITLSKDENKNWLKFCGTITSKKEIQRLFQFLAYYFIFNFSIEKNSRIYSKIESPLLSLVKIDPMKVENVEQLDAYKLFERLYKRKGSIDNMINNYSDYIAKNGSNSDFMYEEYYSVVNFFNSIFEEPKDNEKYNINNLIMIYLILRENNKLKKDLQLIIPREAIYYNSHGIGLSSEGFFKRIFQINKILVEKGII